MAKPLICGFKNCGKPAVCGLINKDSSMTVNVCRDHFKKMKGYPVEEDSKAIRLGIQTELDCHTLPNLEKELKSE